MLPILQSIRNRHKTFNNEAYRILNDDRERIKYLVSIVLKDSSKKQVPPDFLMEMMDVNEQVMMIAMEEDENAKTILKQKIIGINQGLLDQLSDLTHSYDDTLEIKLLVSIRFYSSSIYGSFNAKCQLFLDQMISISYI